MNSRGTIYDSKIMDGCFPPKIVRIISGRAEVDEGNVGTF